MNRHFQTDTSSSAIPSDLMVGIQYALELDRQSDALRLKGLEYEADITSADALDIWLAVEARLRDDPQAPQELLN